MTRWRDLAPRWAAAVACTLALAVGGCATERAPHREPAAAPSGSGGVNRPEHRNSPHLILISFDGFHPDYLDRFDLPAFRRVLQRGTRARAMIPVFPSLTFPNHYSLVTGLYAGRHGIVDNVFYDPVRRQEYSFRNEATVTDATWYRGEPIWVTAETQGMVAACYFWPGSEAAIGGVRPTFWKKYEGSISNDLRVAAVLDWLRLPADRRPRVITLYFSELDSASHRHTLDAPEIERAARSLDRSLGVLLDGIEAMPIRDWVHLLLTSDHGMVETSAAHTVRLGSLVDAGVFRAAYGGPVANLHLAEGARDAPRIRDAINARLRHGRAYLRGELPERYRYSSDPRAGDIIVVMDESWTLATTPPLTGLVRDRWSNHGWDPALPSMHALFAIAGPGIPGGATIPKIENVDVYPLMTELLGLRPAANIDGRPGHLRALIGTPSPAGTR